MAKSSFGRSVGHKGGSGSIGGYGITRGGGKHEVCRPESGAGPMSGGLKSTSVAQGRASGAQPVPKQRPANNWPGHEQGSIGPVKKPDRLGNLRRT